MDQAERSYQKFVAISNGNLNSEETYDSLWECYRANLAMSGTVVPNSSDWMSVKAHLKTIHPFLYNAAAYYQKSNPIKSMEFAKAFIDIPLMDMFDGMIFDKNSQYSTIVFFAASGSYNNGDFRSAIRYLQEYILTGDKSHRRDAFLFLAQACEQISDFALAQKILDQALTEFQDDFDLLGKAINNCIDSDDNVKLQAYLARALVIKPNDKALLGIQGKSYERTGDYGKAISSYTKLKSIQPDNLNIYRHLAADYYNMGVMYFNNGLLSAGSESDSRYLAQAKDYFRESIPLLQTVIGESPESVQFIEALAIAFHCTGDESGFSSTNDQLVAKGFGKVSQNAMPQLLSLENTPTAKKTQLIESDERIPTFSEYAKQYITPLIEKWQVKDPYETIKEYQERVNPASRSMKVKELTEDAVNGYVSNYAGKLKISDFRLMPYDAENEVFLAESKYGEIVIPVPRANNEARTFEMSWTGVQITDVRYCVDGDNLALKSVSFLSPGGRSYTYDNSAALNYTVADVSLNFGEIDYSSVMADGSSSINKIQKKTVALGNSDVDIDIPESKTLRTSTFAFIIANENYQKVSGVQMAGNDGRVLAEYCRKTIGCPAENVRLYEDATYGNLLGAIREMKEISRAFNGEINIIFYYSGHGIPDEETMDAYLLPVDSDGLTTDVCYPMSKLYRELGDLNARSVAVFLDACFSGMNRSGESLTASRGVGLRPKENMPQGNMIVFSAAMGDETAYPYEAKGHGLFTYYLLKKMKETAGDVTFKELGEYIVDNVRKTSVVVNHKSQTPSVAPSFSMERNYSKFRLTD